MRWLRNLFNRNAPAAAAAPTAAPGQPPASVTAGWDSWRALLPEGALAVALDLSLEPAVPDQARPRLLRVAYPLTAPGTDGLPSPAESEALGALAQRSMDLTVTLQEGILFVGEGDRTVEIKMVKLCGAE